MRECATGDQIRCLARLGQWKKVGTLIVRTWRCFSPSPDHKEAHHAIPGFARWFRERKNMAPKHDTPASSRYIKAAPPSGTSIMNS